MGIWDENDDSIMLEPPVTEIRYLGSSKQTTIDRTPIIMRNEEWVHDSTVMNQNILSEHPEGIEVPTAWDPDEAKVAAYNSNTANNGTFEYEEETAGGKIQWMAAAACHNVYMIRKKKKS